LTLGNRGSGVATRLCSQLAGHEQQAGCNGKNSSCSHALKLVRAAVMSNFVAMHDEGLLQRCRDCLAAMATAGVRDKNVFGMRGIMLGRQMFAAVGENSIIVKLRRDEFDAALDQPGVRAFTPGGQPLGLWVEVADDVVADDPDLRSWLAAGLRGIS
jgi:hypothetical protein